MKLYPADVISSWPRIFILAATLVAFSLSNGLAQDQLKQMPGYSRFAKLSQARANAVQLGSVPIVWHDNGKSLEYTWDGKKFRCECDTGQIREIMEATGTNPPAGPAAPGRRSRRSNSEPRPERGRQYAASVSPDGKLRAFYRDRNLWLKPVEGTNELAITTEGNERNRVKLGTATWTYGEELDQITAMWWSSNSQKLAFYRFDESAVPDFYLTLQHTAIQTRLHVEPYPKAGSANPVVDLLIYDVASQKTVRVDVRDGQPFADNVLGHYVYNVFWAPGGSELLFHRTNRRQNILELCAADPETGRCRVVLREEWLPSWVENSPGLRWLQDGRRFIWTSERSGFRNFYLYHLNGTRLATLTDHPFEVANIVRVDEPAGHLYYMARSGSNHMMLQLHRVGLNGRDDVRITDPAFHHTVNLAPDGRHFVDVFETHDQPPSTVLRTIEGRQLAVLARSDLSKFNQLKMRKVELFEFTAADGCTPLYGLLHFPSDFKPGKRYPLLVDVYAGPGTPGARESFVTPNVLTEFGFLYATLDSRSSSGRGKRFLDAIYQQLGIVEIDDQAWGVKALGRRKYVDRARVGIFGTSYGGTASALCLMRYPEVFRAACASSGVTDFRNYDTIYTERYLGLPQEAPSAYDQVKVMSYVPQLKGRLMLFYGTADDNVHPSNTLQLVHALQEAGKSFELQVGPDHGHAGLNRDRMMEFFIRQLVMEK